MRSPSPNPIVFTLAFAFALAGAGTARAELTLTDIHAALNGVWRSGVAWGDFDNDGWLDIVLSGDSLFTGDTPFTRIYHNDGGVAFHYGSNALLGVYNSRVAWGDYDADGDLDLFVRGGVSGNSYAFLYRNDDGFFRHITGPPFTPGINAPVAWIDYDNDGDLDLALSGFKSPTTGFLQTSLFRNDGNSTFTLLPEGLPVGGDAITCADFDNDGYTDLLINGTYMRNLGDGHWAQSAVLPGNIGRSAVGDFDNDGDLDVFVFSSSTSEIYRNDGSAGFVGIHAGTDSLEAGAAKWIDFDNDGYLDVFQTGAVANAIPPAAPTRTHLYRNDQSGHFVPVAVSFPNAGADADWGDFDNDGDADLLLTGAGSTRRLAAVLRVDGVSSNAPPNAPTGLTSQIVGNQLLMSWHAATDDHTPSLGLSYNVRLGTHPGGDDIVPCMADAVTGKRRLSALGNAGEREWMKIQLPPMWDVLYWSVQAIDGAYLGSPFADEEVIGAVPALPTSVSAEAGTDGVHLLWYRAGALGEKNTVYRRETGSNWTALGSAVTGQTPETLSFIDTAVRSGARYAYRLGIPDGSTEVFTEEVWVEVPMSAVAFALEAVQPNPTPGGDIHVSFSLASAARASLALVDTKGRIVATESFSGAGRYSATLRAPQLENGRYFLRLEQSGKTLVRPLTVVE